MPRDADPHADPARVRLSGRKKFTLDLQGPGGVVIVLAWLAAVVGVAGWASGIGQAAGFGLLAYFIGAYFTTLRRQ